MNRIFLNGEEYGGDSSTDISEKNVMFETKDELNPDAPSNIPELKSGKLSIILSTVSTAVKNVRYLFKMLGTTDISAIGDGTLTGAVGAINDNMTAVKGDNEKTYRKGNVNLTPENIGALSVSGGTVSGPIVLRGSQSVFSSGGEPGTDGYIVFARLFIKSGYISHPIAMQLSGRGLDFPIMLCVRFQDVSGVDPGLFSFERCGSADFLRNVYIKKTDVSTWDLCFYKADGFGRVNVDLFASYIVSGGYIGVSYPGTQIDKADFIASEWTPAVCGGKVKEAETLFSYDKAVTHRNIFRGKNLGTSYTAEQKAAIANGSFDDLYVGDYWVINGVTWRIVDIDYWWNSGDTACTTHHLVVMPDSQLYTAQMNETNVTTGGYVGSKMYTENLENAKTLVYAAFGETAVLNHREYLTNAVSDGYPSAGAWYDSKVELPNEIMMYGSLVFTPVGDGSFVPNRYTIDKAQLALMAAHPRYINPDRYWHWLRDVVSGTYFAGVSGSFLANCNNASISAGVRPVFGLC